jgi:hypothetical protein
VGGAGFGGVLGDGASVVGQSGGGGAASAEEEASSFAEAAQLRGAVAVLRERELAALDEVWLFVCGFVRSFSMGNATQSWVLLLLVCFTCLRLTPVAVSFSLACFVSLLVLTTSFVVVVFVCQAASLRDELDDCKKAQVGMELDLEGALGSLEAAQSQVK